MPAERFAPFRKMTPTIPRLVSLALWLAVALGATAHAADAGYATIQLRAAHLAGETVKFNVVLPQGYAASGRAYPALYLLHGYTGHYSDWVTKGHLVEAARNFGEVIVMPEGGDSWYVNHYSDPRLQWENYIIQDLIPYVDGHYRTIAARRGRAIAGLSMGGYGALLLALKHPDLFAAAASLSGAVASARPYMLQGVTDQALKKTLLDDFGPPGSPTRAANDLFGLIQKVPAAELPQLYLAIGSSDFLLESNRRFVALLARLGIPYEYREVPGKHEWPVWDSQIRVVLCHQAPAIGATEAQPCYP